MPPTPISTPIAPVKLRLKASRSFFREAIWNPGPILHKRLVFSYQQQVLWTGARHLAPNFCDPDGSLCRHQHTNLQRFICGLDGCSEAFKTLQSLHRAL